MNPNNFITFYASSSSGSRLLHAKGNGYRSGSSNLVKLSGGASVFVGLRYQQVGELESSFGNAATLVSCSRNPSRETEKNWRSERRRAL